MEPKLSATSDIDAMLTSHGLRRTQAARLVLGWLLANPNTSYTHLQLQSALQTGDAPAFDRVTLYRQIDRLTQAGLLLCRVDGNRVRRYQLMPASVQALPHFECQSCHRDRPLSDTLKADTDALEQAAQSTLNALTAMGYQGMSMDFSVRGLCADCVVDAAVAQQKLS